MRSILRATRTARSRAVRPAILTRARGDPASTIARKAPATAYVYMLPFDGGKVNAYPPGSVIVLPGETWHFHWAKSGEYVTQVTAIGPLGLEYHDLHDDPRHQHA